MENNGFYINWSVALVKCDLCTHKWVACKEGNFDNYKLQCPNCNNLTTYEILNWSENGK